LNIHIGNVSFCIKELDRNVIASNVSNTASVDSICII